MTVHRMHVFSNEDQSATAWRTDLTKLPSDRPGLTLPRGALVRAT